jgi:hypothetical protein
VNREALRAAVLPLVQQLADDLVDVIAARFDSAFDEVASIAIVALMAKLPGAPAKRRKPPQPAKRLKKSTTTPATADAAPLTPPSVSPIARRRRHPRRLIPPPPYQLRAPVARSRADIEAARRAYVSPHSPPPGWTPELDRREELLALSELTARRKCGG